jgi:hypothetical protein
MPNVSELLQGNEQGTPVNKTTYCRTILEHAIV